MIEAPHSGPMEEPWTLLGPSGRLLSSEGKVILSIFLNDSCRGVCMSSLFNNSEFDFRNVFSLLVNPSDLRLTSV